MAQRPDSISDSSGSILGLAAETDAWVPTGTPGVFGPLHRREATRSGTQEVERKPGIKLDAGKPKFFRNVRWQFIRALEALAHHTEKGNAEPGHTPLGWMAVPNGYERYTEALERHLHEEATRVGVSGIADYHRTELIEHATATAWNALARLEHLLADQEE